MSQWRDCRFTIERILVTRRTYSGIVSGHAATIGPSSNVVRSISSRTTDSGPTSPAAASATSRRPSPSIASTRGLTLVQPASRALRKAVSSACHRWS